MGKMFACTAKEKNETNKKIILTVKDLLRDGHKP